jgi:hypothetical protein
MSGNERIDVPYQLILMLPRLATLLAMIASLHHVRLLAAKMKTFRGKERQPCGVRSLGSTTRIAALPPIKYCTIPPASAS